MDEPEHDASSPPQIREPQLLDVNTSPAASPISRRIVPALIPRTIHAQGEDAESYYRRKNRYFGPATTWLSWTKEERTVALSLDRIHGQDLSAHLFNAFNLKRKVQLSVHKAPKGSKKGKQKTSAVLSMSEDDDYEDERRREDGRLGLAKSWTAWPLPPEQVPREDLLSHALGDGNYWAPPDLRPSADLEEYLVATATTLARERWNAREWQSEEEEFSTFKRDMTVEHPEDTEMITSEEDMPAGEDLETERDNETPPPDLAGEGEVYYSRTTKFYTDEVGQTLSPEQREAGDNEPTESDRRPVPIADDEKARQMFLPSARHILSKLDDLLLGLHKARYAYASKPQGRASGQYSQSQTPEASQSRGRSRSRPISRKRGRSPSAENDASSISDTSNTSGKRSRRVKGLGLRDWSDVMGMASLMGWDAAVVERASERCAELFGENMVFRTFIEGDGTAGNESCFTEQLAAEVRGDPVLKDGELAFETDDEPEYYNSRVTKPCTACQISKLPCQPMDGQTGNARTCKECKDSGRECTGITTRFVGSERTCPHKSCPRHTIPFRKQYHLQRHLDSMHAPAKRSKSRSRGVDVPAKESTTTDSESTSASEAQDSTYRILCPIAGCRRAARPFSKGKRLYEHVRTMHPDANVDEVKRLESYKRVERRGKWRDERRRRSKSRGKSQSRDASHGRGRTRAGTSMTSLVKNKFETAGEHEEEE